MEIIDRKMHTKTLAYRYKNDKFIKGCTDQIATILCNSIPKYRLTDNGLVPVYNEETEKLIKSIRELMDNYISNAYPELIVGKPEEGQR